jgi:hypothetical protein
MCLRKVKERGSLRQEAPKYVFIDRIVANSLTLTSSQTNLVLEEDMALSPAAEPLSSSTPWRD